MTTEITNPDIPRVDAVDGPATGMPFLILKSQNAAPADPASVPADAPVVKADGDDPAEDLEAEDKEGGANIDGKSVDDADANAADPGSPAWEATDAAKARVIVDALAQARAGIQELANREDAEGDDYEAAWNLEDAEYAIDAALAILAKFAVDEQIGADQGAAAAEADARALGLIKSLADRHIKKEATVETEAATTTEVAKADETLVAVYSADGKLMGAVNAADLTPLNTGVPADSEAATDGDAPTQGEGVAAPVEDAMAAPAPAAEAAPAPAPEAPAAAAADDVTKSLDERVAEAVAKALEAAVAAAVEPLVKSNEELTERVEKMARSPRDGGPMLSGQRPNSVGPALRGHQADEGSEELRKQLEAETDPGARTLGVAALIKNGWRSAQQ